MHDDYLEVETLQCCAVCEIDGISNYYEPVQVIDALHQYFTKEFHWNNKNGYSKPLLIFTQARKRNTTNSYGDALARYIKKHKLGTVGKVKGLIPNTSKNYVDLFSWAINPKNLKAYYKKYPPAK